MGDSWGPVETFTTMVSPCWYSELAFGSCPVIVPCGCWLFWSGCCCRLAPCAEAHCWATSTVCPTKSGTGRPSATSMATGLVCGHDVPAPGLVPRTVPTGWPDPTRSMLKVRWTRCRAACAAGSLSPFTLGTTEVNGPEETRMVTAEPFAARPDGLVPTTVPFWMLLLCTWDSSATLKPCAVSTAVAWVTESLVTTGIEAYRPEVSHQPPSPSPTPRATTSATTASRGLNSQRCRNGSRPPEYRRPSSRCTTRVREPRPSWSGGPNPLAAATPDRLGSNGPVAGPAGGGAVSS